MVKKIIVLFTLICMIFIVSAADFTPQGDINLRGVYDIKNGVISNFSYYHGDGSNLTGITVSGSVTSVNTSLDYFLYNGSSSGDVFIRFNDTLLNSTIDDRDTDTTYTSGSNLTLVGTIFSANMTSIKEFFDTVYAAIGDVFSGAYSDLTGQPTLLSNFTDDLGDRGFTDLFNFTNGPGYYNSSDFLISNYYLNSNPFTFWNDTYATFNKTFADTIYQPIGSYLTSESDPLWSGNSSSIARIGDCPSGEFVQNTTITGVECSAPAGIGTVTSISSGNGMDFTTITSSGSVTLGTPGTLSGSTSNGLTSTSHTHTITSDDSGDCSAGAICGGGHGHSEYIENILEDSTPQLGGYLDTNGENIGSTTDEIENIYVGDTVRIYFGNEQDSNIYFNGTNLIISG